MVRTFTRKENMSPGQRDTGDYIEADDINELQEAAEGLQTGALPIALLGIEGALGEAYDDPSSVLGSLRASANRSDTRVFDAREWGSLDGTDASSVIQSVLNDAAAALSGVDGSSGGWTVAIDKRVVNIASQIVVPPYVTLRGGGEVGTRLIATEAFPEDTAMVRMGAGQQQYDTGMRLAHLTLDCQDLPGVGGIYSNTWQEPAGLEYVRVRAYRGYAAHIESTASDRVPSHGYFRRCEFFASAEGLDFDYSILIDDAANTHVFDGCTVTCNGKITAGDAAIRVNGADAAIIGGHFEYHTDGVDVLLGSGNKGGLAIVSSTGHDSITTLVHILTDAPTTVVNLRSLGAVNTLVNDISGELLQNTVALYTNRRSWSRGSGRAVAQTDTALTLDASHDVVEVDCSAASRSITLPDPATNKGTQYTVKHVGSANNVELNPIAVNTIDGSATKTITTPGGFLTVYSNGTEYKVIASGGTIT